MNLDISESVSLGEDIKDFAFKKDLKCGVLVCPPAINIVPVLNSVIDSDVKVGAQNCYFENKGAYTGEIAPCMIKATGAEYVIIGHSERRAYFGENNNLLNKKLKAVLAEGLKAILCIGETLEERKNRKTFEVLENQLKEGLAGVDESISENIIIAYEPVWAIGTGEAATNDQVDEAHRKIRAFLKELFPNKAKEVLILYGGSMKPDNAAELLAIEDVNGGLIGGASLKADSFIKLIEIAEDILS